MSTLRSVIDELRLVDTDELTAGELGSELVEVTRELAALEAHRIELLGAFTARGAYEVDGHLSATACLKHRCRLAGRQASDLVRVARALPDMPATTAAFRDGDIDLAAVRLLVDARAAHREVFAGHEQTPVDTARSLSGRRLRMAVGYWRQALDETAALRHANRVYEARRLHLSPTYAGIVRLDGDLDPEGGEIVLTAVG